MGKSFYYYMIGQLIPRERKKPLIPNLPISLNQTYCEATQRVVATMAIELVIRASTTTPIPSVSPSPQSPPCISRVSLKPLHRPNISLSLPVSTSLSLLALFTPSFEARAVSLSKEDIVSSLTQVHTVTTSLLLSVLFSFNLC